jgi:alpha-tubulin suppressor-like RCC1 family protein
VGHSHAGLLTHGGELYTWGSGNAARLGHGHGGAASTPQRVHTLWGAAATVVKCSDSASAAVSQVCVACNLHALCIMAGGKTLIVMGPAGNLMCVLHL